MAPQVLRSLVRYSPYVDVCVARGNCWGILLPEMRLAHEASHMVVPLQVWTLQEAGAHLGEARQGL